MYQEMQDIQESSSGLHSSFHDGFKLAKILFRCASVPTLFVDEDLIILKANANCAQTLGWEEEKLEGQRVQSLLEGHQLTLFLTLQRSLNRDEQRKHKEFLIRTSTGASLRSTLTVQRLDLSEQSVYALYLEDVQTQRHRPSMETASPQHIGSIRPSAFQGSSPTQDQYHQDLAHHIEVYLLPALKKMVHEPNVQVRNNYQEVLAKELSSLTRGTKGSLDCDLIKLTPTEMEVCQYIQAGLSSKEIAEMMHSSFDTIQTHRKNIRKKMGLKGNKTPLCTYLRVEKRLPTMQAEA